MTSLPNDFDLLNYPLTSGSRCLIEAAAGSGKTFTLENLYIRLLTEGITEDDGNIYYPSVDEILVVTFTEAATAELIERLRHNLSNAVVFLTDWDRLTEKDHQSIIGQILNKTASQPGTRKHIRVRLEEALADFDRAAIQTIHGFCNRILSDFAFEAAIPLNTELTGDNQQFITEVVNDYWRQRFYDENTPFAKGEIPVKPKELIMLAQSFSSDPEVKVSPDVDSILSGAPEIDQTEARELILADFIHYLRSDQPLKRLKERLHQQAYDDLLLNLRSVLRESSPATNLIRSRYKTAMIDEFQDTDPVQYEIFSSLFNRKDAMFIMVGDPKQSIYRFRGADVYAYLDAAAELKPEERTTLSKNYRSTAPLITAMNGLFDVSDPFYEKDIIYHKITAGSEPPVLTLPGLNTPESPLIFRLVNPDSSSAKGLIVSAIIRDVSAEISRLLAPGSGAELTGMDKYGNPASRPVKSSDIAILTSSNKQAEDFQNSLREHGIIAVIKNRNSIFHSPEASQMHYLLAAVAEPDNRRAFNTALSSDFFNLPPDILCSLLRCEGDLLSPEYESFSRFILELKELWHEFGLMRMLNRLMRFVVPNSSRTVRENLVTGPGGERRITNMLHLAELLHDEERSRRLAPNSVIAWLGKMIREEDSKEEFEPRLESDREAVNILTVHKSKGLQFPVVYCPFLWQRDWSRINAGGTPPGRIIHCESTAPDHHKEAVLALNVNDAAKETNNTAAKHEELAEQMRLTYVALTRAQSCCILYWHPGSGKNALSYLLMKETPDHGPEHSLEDACAKLQSIPEISFSDHNVFSMKRAKPLDTRKTNGENLSRKTMLNAVPASSEVFSFSSLISHRRDPERDLTGDDEFEEIDASTAEEVEAPTADSRELPSGRGFGSCIHEILDEMDISSVRDSNWNKGENEILICRKMRKYSLLRGQRGSEEFESAYEKYFNAVCDMLEATLRKELSASNASSFRLCDIPAHKILSEMSFTAAIPAPVDLELFEKSLAASGLISQREKFEDIISKGSLQLEHSRNERKQGWLYGIIDLVFEVDGRYYLLDWKTNIDREHNDIFSSGTVLKKMYRSAYLLQAAIYSLAVDRWLKASLPDYDYETHFGGYYYLFMRGINPNNDNGVFFDRPSPDFINELNRAFPGIN